MTSGRYGDFAHHDLASNVSLSEKQDSMFDSYLEEMKPFVLRLTHKSERQKVGLWIKKLCEPPGHNPAGRKNRNLYAQLLLHMLKRGVLEDPFSRRPESGLLQALPSYMSIYLDEPVMKRIPGLGGLDEEFGRDPPDWVRDLGSSSGSVYSDASLPPRTRRELPTTSGAHPVPPPRSTTHSSSSERNGREVPLGFDEEVDEFPYRMKTAYGSNAENGTHVDIGRYSGGRVSPRRRSENAELLYGRDYGHADSGYPSTSPTSRSNQYNGFSQHSKGPSTALNSSHEDHSFSRSHDRELELKVKMMEAKFHEDKLKIQQQHDVAVQKILDRKNMELEEVKSHYRNKLTEMEATIKKHERKAAQLVREAQTMREQRDKQIAELKVLAEETGESAQHNFEKKLNDKIAEFEQEKFEMQKQHTKNIQELLDDTNQRLQKMETEYSQQSNATGVLIQELEARVQQLTHESEGLQNSRTKLAKEKEELEHQVTSLMSELHDAKSTMSKLERDHSRNMSDHQSTIEHLQKKTDSSIEIMKQEHAAATARAAETISDLEAQINQYKQALQEAEFQRQKHVRELDAVQQQEKVNMEHLHDKKIRGLQAEMDQQEAEYQKRLRKLETSLKEREDHIQKLSELQKQQAQQAEQALEDFKSQVERNSGRMFDEMKSQMEKVEEDLARSKSLREKQAKEFSKQVEDIKLSHNREMAELKIVHEQERAALIRSHQGERDAMLKEQENEREMQVEKLRQTLENQDSQARNRATKDAKTVAELEQQVRELREELIQSSSAHKTQLMELSLLRQEEQQNHKRQEENTQAKFKSQLEQQKLQFQREHSADMEQLLEKTNNRVKQLEQEYDARSTKGQESIDILEGEIKKLKEDNIRTRNSLEKKLTQSAHKTEEEKAGLKKHHTSVVKSLQQDLDTQKTMVRHLEKRCQQMELDSQERVSRLRLQYEEKLRGLMPASLREELEDTIDSLKQQNSVIQSRAQLLQEELDTRNKLSTSFNLSSLRLDDEA